MPLGDELINPRRMRGGYGSHWCGDLYFSLITACLGCPDGFTCCARVWGECVFECPTWNNCCTRIPDPVCEAENLACLALKEPIELVLKGAEEVVDASRHTLEVASLIVPEGALVVVQGAVDVAEGAVEGVLKSYAAGLKAAEFIAKLGINGIISIRRISFSTALDTAAGGSFLFL